MVKVKVKDPAAEPTYDNFTIATAIIVGVLAILSVSVHLGSAISGSAMTVENKELSWNPISLVAGLLRGQVKWTKGATVVLVVIVAVLLLGRYLWRRVTTRGTAGRLGIDYKADVMATGGELSAMTEQAVRDKAKELKVRLPYDAEPGVCIGVSVSDGMKLYGSYEDLHLDIWGPRQGKTSSRVIPAILDAPGAVLVTSNKRDVVDATRAVRESRRPGSTFVFDPQGVAQEQPSWCWDPIAWVRGTGNDLIGAEVRAAKLAGHFADSDDGLDARSDAFFDPEGEDLLAGLFLAAARESHQIHQVWEWISRPADDTPVTILRRIHENYPGASGLAAQYNATGRTKEGIFGTAKKMARCLRLTGIYAWINPDAGGRLFDEMDFIQNGGTLYSLSMEGRGTAAPLISAMTEAIIDVAMTRLAVFMPLGRLEVPLVAILDEAANIVRWKDLPKLYSHLGSRGIVVMTVLQSWAQGARCWGVDGMTAMWAAANIRVIGSGLDDINFLRDRSEAIGDYDVVSKSVSKSSGGKSYSSSLGGARTFTTSELLSLPQGRVIVFPSGGRAALARTVPWWEGKYADEVQAAIELSDPRRPTTYADLRNQSMVIDSEGNPESPQEVQGI